MAPDSFRAADTREWMVRAEDDLGAAADLLALPTPRLRAALFHCQQSYAWKFRYPGAAYEPTREEAEGALRAAREVVRAVRERLPAEAQP